jgi:hypothetical protein
MPIFKNLLMLQATLLPQNCGLGGTQKQLPPDTAKPAEESYNLPLWSFIMHKLEFQKRT